MPTRRDVLEACKLTGVKLKDFEESDEAQMAVVYIEERRTGETDLEFEGWLDADIEGDEGQPDPS